MKLNTIQRFSFVGDYYDYTSAQDPLTGVVRNEYFLVGPVYCMLQSEGNESATSVYTKSRLRGNGILRNLRDRSGNFVYVNSSGEPVEAYIGTIEPIINVWGLIDGYRYEISRAS